jgi:hypothetical protein
MTAIVKEALLRTLLVLWTTLMASLSRGIIG